MIFKNNKRFDTLKWIALILIPALVTLILAVGQIWSLPYYEKIGATIAALGVFLGALLKVSTSAYNKALENEEIGTIKDPEELEEQNDEEA